MPSKYSEVRMTTKKRFGKICDVFLGEMYLLTTTQLLASNLCDSWNAHDKLKAKAELLSNAVKALSDILGDIVHEHGSKYGDAISNEMLYFGLHDSSLTGIEVLLAEAKELEAAK